MIDILGPRTKRERWKTCCAALAAIDMVRPMPESLAVVRDLLRDEEVRLRRQMRFTNFAVFLRDCWRYACIYLPLARRARMIWQVDLDEDPYRTNEFLRNHYPKEWRQLVDIEAKHRR